MKKLIYMVVMIVCFITSNVNASNRVEIVEGNVVFTLPDVWEKQPIKGSPKMDASDPLFLVWKREGIVDKKGTSVIPGLNIVIFNIQKNADIVLLSHLLMKRRGWPFKGFLSFEEDGVVLPNSLAYLTEFKANNEMLLKCFVIHSINNGIFVEVALSATDDIFAQVEPEFRDIIKSIHLIKNP